MMTDAVGIVNPRASNGGLLTTESTTSLKVHIL